MLIAYILHAIAKVQMNYYYLHQCKTHTSEDVKFGEESNTQFDTAKENICHSNGMYLYLKQIKLYSIKTSEDV